MCDKILKGAVEGGHLRVVKWVQNNLPFYSSNFYLSTDKKCIANPWSEWRYVERLAVEHGKENIVEWVRQQIPKEKNTMCNFCKKKG
jgi:hypothetical protein